jgi:hypothetical protein
MRRDGGNQNMRACVRWSTMMRLSSRMGMRSDGSLEWDRDRAFVIKGAPYVLCYGALGRQVYVAEKAWGC